MKNPGNNVCPRGVRLLCLLSYYHPEVIDGTRTRIRSAAGECTT